MDEQALLDPPDLDQEQQPQAPPAAINDPQPRRVRPPRRRRFGENGYFIRVEHE